MVAAQTNFISAESMRLSSGINLYRALGGGAVREEQTVAAASVKGES